MSATDGPLLLIGFGNELRGDDGAGCRAARRLRACLGRHGRSVAVLTPGQLLPELAEPISRARLVIFLDASCRAAAGQVRRTRLQPAAEAGSAMAHHQTAEGLLGMARRLYGRAPAGWLHAIGASGFGYTEAMSPQVRRAVGRVVRDIARRAAARPGRGRRRAHSGCALSSLSRRAKIP